MLPTNFLTTLFSILQLTTPTITQSTSTTTAALTTSTALSAPATIFFTPFLLPNCIQSTDFSTFHDPTSYAVTSGRCINSTYEFVSYFAVSNFPSRTPCVMSVFPKPDCEGTSVGVQAGPCGNCSSVSTALGGSGVGWSFELACGP